MARLEETVILTVRVKVDVDYLAEQFAALTDDAQAQFFCKVAAKLGPDVAGNQAWYIGRHLAVCDCSTEAGREFVQAIAARALAGAKPALPET